MNIYRSESGAAMVEFAVFLSFLCTIFAGVVDYSMAIQQTIRVETAANAGAEFGIIPGNESNISGIEAAAVTAASGVPGFAVTASNTYECIPGGGAVTSTTTCTAAPHTDAGTPIKYIVVNTSATLPSIYAYPGMPKNLTVTGSSTMRGPW